MTQHEREKICRVIGMLSALEFAEENEGIANSISEAREKLDDLLESEEED